MTIRAARESLVIPRHQPKSLTFRLRGVDLTGADYRLQVRKRAGAPGEPLLDLGPADEGESGLSLFYAGTATVGQHIDAGRLEGIPRGLKRTSLLALSLLVLHVEDEQADLPSVSAFELVVTLPDADPRPFVEGPFAVRTGVNQ